MSIAPSNQPIVSNENFLKKQFSNVARFAVSGEVDADIDYANLYLVVDKHTVKAHHVKPLTHDQTNYLLIRVVTETENKNEDDIEAPSFHIRSRSIKSNSISLDVATQQNIFSGFMNDDESGSNFNDFFKQSMNKNALKAIDKSPPAKKQKLDNPNISNHNNANNNNNITITQYLFIAELEESKEPNFTSQIKSFERIGNLNLAINSQLIDDGKVIGNVLLVHLVHNNKLMVKYIQIPLVQQFINKPSKILEKLCFAIIQSIGTHAELNAMMSYLMKVYILEYLVPQIRNATKTLKVFTAPGGYNVVQSDGQTHRIVIYSNQDKVVNYTIGEVVHPWNCGVFLDFKSDASLPSLIPGQIHEPLPDDMIDLFCEMYDEKGVMIFCKLLALCYIGLTNPNIFRLNGGVNPGNLLFSDRDQGKSFFLRYIAAAMGCPTAGKNDCSDAKVILANYTAASVQIRCAEFPGWLFMFEDADRATGNKAYLSIFALIWILCEINKNTTASSGDRDGAQGAYVLTANTDLSCLLDDAAQSRLFVDIFDCSRLADADTLKINKMTAKASLLQRALAARVEYLVLNCAPSDGSTLVMSQVLSKLKQIVQSKQPHLDKYLSNRSVSLYGKELSYTFKIRKLLFGNHIHAKDTITPFVDSINTYLNLCHDVRTDPLQFAMRHSFVEYLRFLLFARQCSLIDVESISLEIEKLDVRLDVEQIDLLKEIEQLITLNISHLSIIMKETWVGVHIDVKNPIKTLKFSDITDLCSKVVIYNKKFGGINSDVLQLDDESDNKNNVNEKIENDEEVNIFSSLSQCWNDKMLYLTEIEKCKFMNLGDLFILFELADKNKKIRKENNYKTYRAYDNRYFAFLTPDNLLYLYKLCINPIKRSKKDKKQNKDVSNKDASNKDVDKQKIAQIITHTSQINDFIQSIRNIDAFKYFNTAVDLDKYEDYGNIITQPIDLSIIMNKNYSNYEEFANDIKLMSMNALKYNNPGSVIFVKAEKILNLLFDSVARINVGGNNNNNNKSNNSNENSEEDLENMFDFNTN